MAQQEDVESKQSDSDIAKAFLNDYFPDTLYAENESETYAQFESETTKNMFLQSVRDGEVEIALKLVLYDVVNVSVCDGYGNTALHYSCYFNRLRLIDFILKCNGIDINQSNTSDATPLHLATEMKHVEAARKLINADGYQVDLDAANLNGWTPLHFACFVNVAKMNNTKKKEDEKENENDTDIDQKQQINDEINVDLIRLLVDNGCNVQIENSSNKKAFDLQGFRV